MIISINWLKQFTEIDGSIDELATLIGARLVEIEKVIDLGKKYEGVTVARVVECNALEGSDHLNVTRIDDGGAVEGVERDENGYVQVVCGAPNVRAGILVAWLPPTSTVPETYSDKDPFVLGARKLRGAMSNGMLASAKELDLFDDHSGILEIDKEVAPGNKFADVYELNDYLLDIENKSLTHRPDAFGIIGFAREVAAIQGKPFKTPDWLRDISPVFAEKEGVTDAPNVTIDDPALCSRYQAVILSGADGKTKSPLEIQTYLARVGVRPISAVVDVTNYLMMLTGQPLHAFDYDKLLALNEGRADIHVRTGRENETLLLLDGRTITLSENDIVIANGETPVALAGAMGGANTDIDDNTQNIILESATFNLYNLRNTQMRHGIFSEAITRFTKGQPANLTSPVLAAAVRLLRESAGARLVSDVADAYPSHQQNDTIEIAVQKVNDTLGSKFAAADIVDILQSAEFVVAVNNETHTLAVEAPYWRTDIHIIEDIIEEIGRLSGFDSIEPILPGRDFTAVSPSSFDRVRTAIRNSLTRAGANEVLTYNFIHGDILRRAGQDAEGSYRITNSISPDLQYYRQTLTPSLLTLVHSNVKAGYDRFALYEINKGHSKSRGLDDENVPYETDYLAITFAAKRLDGAAYYQVKKLVDYVARELNMNLVYKPLDDADMPIESSSFERRRSANVIDLATGEFIGVVGEYKSSVRKAFKLPEFAAGCELDLNVLARLAEQKSRAYVAPSRFPSAERDVCFQVANDVSYQAVFESASIQSEDVRITISPLDIYQPTDASHKNITLRFAIVSPIKTLTSDEVAQYIDEIVASVTTSTGATVI